jgi:hypothetical protein
MSPLRLGRAVTTRGVGANGNDFVAMAMQLVETFSAFTKDNEPYGEHDWTGYHFATQRIDSGHSFSPWGMQ